MAALQPEILLPGHGFPVVGVARVGQVLNETASLFESLVEQTLALMNQGASLDDVLGAVQPPAELLQRPYLRPIYDEPEFIVRNIWRLYGGWYDGNPAHLKPAPDADLAVELASLAGGREILSRRCRELVEAGRLDLAGHLGEIAVQAFPDDADAHELRAEVLRQRAASATSTMAKGIFASAATESEESAARLRAAKSEVG
jgi:alkyl sulfatase BDS1-like metallo-beta-lactamase superfamily hydrolase